MDLSVRRDRCPWASEFQRKDGRDGISSHAPVPCSSSRLPVGNPRRCLWKSNHPSYFRSSFSRATRASNGSLVPTDSRGSSVDGGRNGTRFGTDDAERGVRIQPRPRARGRNKESGTAQAEDRDRFESRTAPIRRLPNRREETPYGWGRTLLGSSLAEPGFPPLPTCS